MSFKRLLLLITTIVLFGGILNAGEESLQIQKDEIWAIAKLYKKENMKRSLRLPPAPKANIANPVYKQPRKQAQAAAIAPAVDNQPRIYTFDTTTAWGTYKAQVTENPGKMYFDVSFESPHPVQGITIRDTSRKMDIESKNLSNVYSPEEPIRINYAYQPMYLLILKASISGEIQPQILPLYKKANVKTAE